MKAYDVKELLNILKGKGLNIAEDAAEIVLESVMEWLKASAQASPTVYDDMMLLVIPQLEKLAKDQIDKIDGEEG